NVDNLSDRPEPTRRRRLALHCHSVDVRPVRSPGEATARPPAMSASIQGRYRPLRPTSARSCHVGSGADSRTSACGPDGGTSRQLELRVEGGRQIALNPMLWVLLPALWRSSEEKEDCKDHQMDDTLEHRSPTRSQSDHADNQG